LNRAIEATYRPDTANADSLTVEVVMSSATPYLRRSWFDGLYNETLSHDPEHVRLGRMQSGAPVLDNHDRFSSVDDTVVGVVEQVRLDDDKMIGLLRFDKGEKGASIFRKIQDGILRKFSIGYTVYRYEDEERDGQITERTVTDWEPYEVSVVPVPADNTASSRSADPPDNLNNQADNMKTENNAGNGGTSVADDAQRSATPAAPAPAPAPAAPTVDEGAIRAEERDRIKLIRSQVEMAGLDNDLARKLIDSGVSATEAARKITEAWQAKDTTEINTTPGSAAVVGEERRMEDFGRAIEDSILLRSGAVRGMKAEGQARELANLSMIRLMEKVLAERGVSTRGKTNYQIAKMAFERAGAGHSSTDFPILFNNVINRSLQAAYSYQNRTFLDFTTGTTHPDFRLQEKARLSSMVDGLDLIPEGGEYKASTFQESVEGYRVAKYGKLLTYTMEMAVNDNIGFFQRVPAAGALAAAQRQSDVVYGILTGNPNMADGNALFSAQHGNLLTGAAITDASLALAKAAFMKQTDQTGKFINVTPRFLIVSPDRMHEAQKILTSVQPDQTANVNVHAGTLELIVEPRLGSGWFLAADPNGIDTIEYAFLAGQPELFTETDETFNIDGTQVKARMVFGTKAIDWRGLMFNPGA
jgi:HK97 family phage prohead protease